MWHCRRCNTTFHWPWRSATEEDFLGTHTTIGANPCEGPAERCTDEVMTAFTIGGPAAACAITGGVYYMDRLQALWDQRGIK